MAYEIFDWSGDDGPPRPPQKCCRECGAPLNRYNNTGKCLSHRSIQAQQEALELLRARHVLPKQETITTVLQTAPIEVAKPSVPVVKPIKVFILPLTRFTLKTARPQPSIAKPKTVQPTVEKVELSPAPMVKASCVPQMSKVIGLVCDACLVRPESLLEWDGMAINVTLPQQVLMYLLRIDAKVSSLQIGILLGGFTQDKIHHQVRIVDRVLHKGNKQLRDKINLIRSRY